MAPEERYPPQTKQKSPLIKKRKIKNLYYSTNTPLIVSSKRSEETLTEESDLGGTPHPWYFVWQRLWCKGSGTRQLPPGSLKFLLKQEQCVLNSLPSYNTDDHSKHWNLPLLKNKTLQKVKKEIKIIWTWKKQWSQTAIKIPASSGSRRVKIQMVVENSQKVTSTYCPRWAAIGSY